MDISYLKTNHIKTPMGIAMEKPIFSWCVEKSTGKMLNSVRIRIARDERMDHILFDSGIRQDISPLSYQPDFLPKPRTRYYWQVQATAEDGDAGEAVSWFETGKMKEPWQAGWISSPFEGHPVLYRKWHGKGELTSARLYICGLGLYEAYINGHRVGDAYLTPGYTAYEKRICSQAYDVTALLREENTLAVMLGKGWYMGRYGFGEAVDKIYGSRMQLLAELHITYRDGSTSVIATDGDWRCTSSPIKDSEIYDGEIYDARLEAGGTEFPVCTMLWPEGAVEDSEGIPVVIRRQFAPAALLHTPKGELVLDFGQILSGWVCFDDFLRKGSEVVLEYGELLQEGCFYRENLRTARASYTYISNGNKRQVRPHFTYYGFRYVRITGMNEQEIRQAHFIACAVYSDLDEVSRLQTSNEKVNKLIQNILWSQRGNFVEIPTDCPQRDERMGWTGDAQVFCRTACCNMDAAAFFRKYLRDMKLEQQELGGSVPFVVPDALSMRRKRIGKQEGGIDATHGSSGWGDAATVIPWTLYQFYGDKYLLEEQYENMKLWVDYIYGRDREDCGGTYLWSCGFHFGDWLALDNPIQGIPLGATEATYMATAYYYLSAALTAKAAAILGKGKDAEWYAELAGRIKTAFQNEYFTSSGRCAMPTQTALFLALYLKLVPEEYENRAKADLKKRLAMRGNHLDTGFVGTPVLCPALSEYGLHDLAVTLLLQEDYPGWLYEVNLGATTVWERWNSLMPDGKVSDTGMNSMNHYAYGSVAAWIWTYLVGIAPKEPGFRRAVIRPLLDERFSYVEGEFRSAAGRYVVRWEREVEKICYRIVVPFDAQAEVFLGKGARVSVDGKDWQSAEEGGSIWLESGEHEIIQFT